MSRLLTHFLSAVCAISSICSCGLSVSGVSPNVVTAGDTHTLQVEGSGFSEDVLFALSSEGVDVSLTVQSVSENEAEVLVPAAAPALVYDLVATRGSEQASLESALTVTAEKLSVIFVDVGQGDATLVIAPTGEVLLIDGGGFDADSSLQQAIDAHAAGRIDAVVVSHHDADHLEGVVNVLSGEDGQAGTTDDLTPSVLMAPDDDSCDTQTCNRFRALAAYARLTVPLPGDAIALGDIDVQVVSSNGRVGAAAAPSGLDANGRSIAVQLSYAGRRVLILGDLTGGGLGTADLEGPLSQETGPVDILRTAHHGSATSSSEPAMNRWAPRLSVLSMGTDNAYCHPDQTTLDRISAASLAVVATGYGIVNDIDRCDAATSVPANASVGNGTMVLTITAGGDMALDGEAL